MTDQELVDLYAGRTGHSINPLHLAGLRRLAAATWAEGYHDAAIRVDYANQPDAPGKFDNPYLADEE